jgi:hypothetical protein
LSGAIVGPSGSRYAAGTVQLGSDDRQSEGASVGEALSIAALPASGFASIWGGLRRRNASLLRQLRGERWLGRRRRILGNGIIGQPIALGRIVDGPQLSPETVDDELPSAEIDDDRSRGVSATQCRLACDGSLIQSLLGDEDPLAARQSRCEAHCRA